MIRRNCCSLKRFGAVAVALLLALPALADEIEPEPYVEEEVVEPEPEPEVEAEVEKEAEVKVAKQRVGTFSKVFDAIVIRPFNFSAIIVGGVFFLPAALMASLGGAGNVQDAWEQFVAPSVERTFMRPLGEL